MSAKRRVRAPARLRADAMPCESLEPRLLLSAAAVRDVAVELASRSVEAVVGDVVVSRTSLDPLNPLQESFAATDLVTANVVSTPANMNSFGDVTAVTDGRVFIAGQRTDEVDEYNVNRHAWATLHLSQARDEMTAVGVGQTVLFAGGQVNATPSDVVDVYDISTQTWSTTHLPVAMVSPKATVAGSAVVFTSTQSDGADAYVYDTATGQWSTAPLSLARLVQDTVTVGHDALLVGGNAAGQTVANVDVYDGDTGQWSTAMLSEARGGFATAVSGNVAVFAAGGIPSPTDAVDLFNATTGQWTSGHLSVARFGVQAVAVGSLVVLAGGTDSHGTSQAVDVYNARTGRWYASQMPNGSLSVGIAMGNKAVFGVQEPLHLPSSADIQDPGRAEVLDISTGTWTQLKLGWRFTPTAAYPTARGVMLTASDTDGTYDGYVGDELIATNDRPPVPLDPRPGATVSSATEVFRWSAVPGATSYTVYINDDTATYQLPATRLPLTALNTIDIGSRNTIQIVANFPHGQTVSGDRYSFGSNFPDVRVTVASSGIPGGTLTPASTWTVKADVLNNYISRWTGPLRIEAYASSDGTLNGPLRLLGSATTTHVLLGATASVSIPVSLSAFAAVKGTTRATLLLVAEPLVPGRRRVPPRNVYSTAIGDSFSVKA